jgi:eukaryotic-like serine/threonine-protein kinase
LGLESVLIEEPLMARNWYLFKIGNPARKMVYHGIIVLGEGGFGEVWAGLTQDSLPIAIKVFKPTSDPSRDFIRWYNEQDINLRCLGHRHIVQTYDQFVTPEGDLVIVMEQAEGSLDSYIRINGPLHPTHVCGVGLQILSALKHVHNLGVIHRDVTLRNILYFPNGLVKLSDFGISKETVSAEEFARTFIGQKHAIPPELLHAGYTSQQSDIYQLGLCLLTLLTGSPPIPGNMPARETYDAITDGLPRQIAESLIPKHGTLAEILSIMLRRRCEWRYQHVDEVREDLRAEYEQRRNLASYIDWLTRKQQNPFMPPHS